MKVKIIKQNHPGTWYKAGDIIEVSEKRVSANCHKTSDDRWVFAEDFVVIPDQPRLYTHDGIQYELPEWATYVTRDGVDKLVFAWEFKPENTGEGTNYANFQDNKHNGKRKLLKAYIPLPEGAFIEDVSSVKAGQ